MFTLIAQLKERGVSVVYVSHKMDEIFRLCDRITVLHDGETVATKTVADTTPEEVVRLMVGRAVTAQSRPARHPGEIVLSVDRLTTAKLHNISFDLRRGEVLGVAGLVGAGRSELGAALIGRDAIRGGSFHLHGKRLCLLPEDRRVQGLMMNMSVLENGTLAVLPSLQRAGLIDHSRERAEFTAAADRVALRCASADAPVSTLSGGNQQKVLLSRWLLANPDVLFLDDPTRGIDIAAKQDIYAVIDRLAVAGKGVLLVSSELPELFRCCDRILVLCEGRLAAVYDAKEATPEQIMASATNLAPR